MFKIENRFSNVNVQRNVRFTDQLFDELNDVAAKHNVSFNMLVLQCCRYALDNMEKPESE